MKTESTEPNGSENNTFPSELYLAGMNPSITDKMKSSIASPGSLLANNCPNEEEFTELKSALGLTVPERVVSFTPQISRSIRSAIFAGGVCALSTRENTQLKRGIVEDPTTGRERYVKDGALTDVVTIVQVLETIGLTDKSSLIVLEDTLWSDRVEFAMRLIPGVLESAVSAARESVLARNQRTTQAVRQLRNALYTEPQELTVLRDSDILLELKDRTDAMFKNFGIAVDPATYRVVYAGMYSYVWREILKGQGIIDEPQTLVIYEPWKHAAPEDGALDPISTFRQTMLKAEPFMTEGSKNDKVGLIAYAEPRDPNGRILRKSLPTAFLPNTKNYRDFDFGKFPIVPKKKNALPTAGEFNFVDKLDNIIPSQNPAYLWGLVYPPTPKTFDLMSRMLRINKSIRAAMDTPTIPKQERQEYAKTLRQQRSCEMLEFSENLIGELVQLTNVTLGENNGTN